MLEVEPREVLIQTTTTSEQLEDERQQDQEQQQGSSTNVSSSSSAVVREALFSCLEVSKPIALSDINVSLLTEVCLHVA